MLPFHSPVPVVITFLTDIRFFASVGKHVSPQTAWILAREVALIACKRFFSRMLPQVSLEITSLLAWIVALVTTQMLLPWMCWHVLFQVATCCGGIGALGAIEWSFSWMSEQVLIEITCCFAGVVALFATMGLFSWMGPHVDSKIASCCKGEGKNRIVKFFCSKISNLVEASNLISSPSMVTKWSPKGHSVLSGYEMNSLRTDILPFIIQGWKTSNWIARRKCCSFSMCGCCHLPLWSEYNIYKSSCRWWWINAPCQF